jgi:hypothetical protein
VWGFSFFNSSVELCTIRALDTCLSGAHCKIIIFFYLVEITEDKDQLSLKFLRREVETFLNLRIKISFFDIHVE